MYAPRQPNARPAIGQDPGRIDYFPHTADIGFANAAAAPTSMPPDAPPDRWQPEGSRDGRLTVAPGTTGSMRSR